MDSSKINQRNKSKSATGAIPPTPLHLRNFLIDVTIFLRAGNGLEVAVVLGLRPRVFSCWLLKEVAESLQDEGFDAQTAVEGDNVDEGDDDAAEGQQPEEDEEVHFQTDRLEESGLL